MTSQTFSAKNKIALYDLRYSFKTTFAVPLALFVLLILTLTLDQKSFLDNKTALMDSGFILVGYNTTWSIIAILFIGGILTALNSFHFINSVKKTNVFLSMNISRKRLFCNRCLTSSIYLFLAVAIPFSLNLFFCVDRFGNKTETMTAWIYLLLGMLACVFSAFSITAFAMTFAGNILESVLYAGTFLATPTALFLGIEFLMGKYLNGFICTAFKAESFSTLYLEGGSLFSNTRIINPFFFFENLNMPVITNGLQNYSMCGAYDLQYFQISMLEYISVLFWIVLSVVFLFLAVHSFNKRKAENAECNGSNKTVSTFTTFMIMFGSFALSTHYLNTGKLLTLMISFIISTIVYVVTNILIFKRKMDTMRAIRKVPILLGIFLLLSVVFMTGCFGYTKAIPELNEIEEAYVTSPINDNLFFGGANITGWGSTNNVLISIDGYMELTGGFTSENDLKKILSIHKNMTISENVTEKMDFCIVYKLKNGTIMKRCFEYISDENYNEVLSLANSDFCREVFTKKFSATDEELISFYDELEANAISNKNDAFAVYKMDFWKKFSMPLQYSSQYSQANLFYIYNKNGEKSNKSLAELLTEDEYFRLRKCILEDMLDLTERYLPQSKVIGMIPFCSSEGVVHVYNNWFMDNLFNQSTIIITENMSKTLAFLEEKDMMKYFNNDKEIVSVRIMPFSDAKTKLYSMIYSEQFGRLFSIEGATTSDEYSSTGTTDIIDAFDGYPSIIENDKISRLYAVSYPFSFIHEDGYIVKYIFSDGSSVNLYLPHEYQSIITE